MDSSPSFRFNAGCLALDLAATLRRRPSARDDLLRAPGTAAHWLAAAGVTPERLPLDAQQETQLRQLREAIHAAASSLAQGLAPAAADIATINRLAAHPVPAPRLDVPRMALKWSAQDPFCAALSLIARDALDLIAGPRADLIRACAQEDCRMLFVDASPGRRRRWCSMTRCGSRAKGATFRRKQLENA